MREAEAALRTLERLRQGFGGEGEAGNDDEGEDDEQPKIAAMSDRLAQRLSAHRTAALQIEVARHPQAALAAVVHGMVQTILQGSHYGHDLPLGVSLKVQDRLEGMAPDWPESPAAVALRELQQVAGEALPEDGAELFAALLAKPQDELVRLLAVCVASTVDVVTPRTTARQPGAELAQAVGLDMAAWWKPTADGYFQHVPKAAILEAVGAFAPSNVTRLAKLKKGDIASEAERLADGTGWMPAVFLDDHHTEPEDVPEVADEVRRKMPPRWRTRTRWPREADGRRVAPGFHQNRRGGGRARFQRRNQSPVAAFGQAATGGRASALHAVQPSARWRGQVSMAPRRNGRACGATPRLAAAGCTKACRPRRWRFRSTTSRRTGHEHAARPRLWSFHATPQARCRLRRQGAFSLCR